MDDAFFAENTLIEINVPEDPNLDIEAALSSPDPEVEGNVTSLIPSIPQRNLLYFGGSSEACRKSRLLLIVES